MDWLYRFTCNPSYPDPLEEIDFLCSLEDDPLTLHTKNAEFWQLTGDCRAVLACIDGPCDTNSRASGGLVGLGPELQRWNSGRRVGFVTSRRESVLDDPEHRAEVRGSKPVDCSIARAVFRSTCDVENRDASPRRIHAPVAALRLEGETTQEEFTLWAACQNRTSPDLHTWVDRRHGPESRRRRCGLRGTRRWIAPLGPDHAFWNETRWRATLDARYQELYHPITGL